MPLQTLAVKQTSFVMLTKINSFGLAKNKLFSFHLGSGDVLYVVADLVESITLAFVCASGSSWMGLLCCIIYIYAYIYIFSNCELKTKSLVQFACVSVWFVWRL